MHPIPWFRNRFSTGTDRTAPTRLQSLGLSSLLLFPLCCWLILEYFNYKALFPADSFSERILLQLNQFGMQLLFGVLVLYLLFFLLLLLVRRAFVATGLLGLLALLFGFINYMKIKLNSVPFLPMDFALVGVTKELASYVSIAIPKFFWLALVLVLGWTVALALLRTKFPGRWFLRLPAAVAILLAVAVACSSSSRTSHMLNAFHMDFADGALQQSNYTANGFSSAFTMNLLSLRVDPPEGYSQEAVMAILQDYTGSPTDPDAPEYDVILILAESFFDLRELDGVTYSEDLLQNYDAILDSENCYSGNIYIVAHGGGTVYTEFRMLTGLHHSRVLPSGATPYDYVSRPLSGYVSNYQAAGYRTIGLHLYNPNFYSRARAYPYLGFDAFYGLEDVAPLIDISYTRGYATDLSTERAIEYYMDQGEDSGQPTFLFAITIENHQPYGANENNTVSVTADVLNELQLQALTTYAQGVKDADEMLGALKAYIDGRDRPTVLVWFGDHLPTLGESNLPYYAMGYYAENDNSLENRMQIYHAPFFVYANCPLQQGLFSSKSDNQLSDLYLMECVAAATGFQQTPYMEFLADCIPTLPVYSVTLNMDNSLTDAQEGIPTAWSLIAYDRLLGKDYSR